MNENDTDLDSLRKYPSLPLWTRTTSLSLTQVSHMLFVNLASLLSNDPNKISDILELYRDILPFLRTDNQKSSQNRDMRNHKNNKSTDQEYTRFSFYFSLLYKALNKHFSHSKVEVVLMENELNYSTLSLVVFTVVEMLQLFRVEEEVSNNHTNIQTICLHIYNIHIYFFVSFLYSFSVSFRKD